MDSDNTLLLNYSNWSLIENYEEYAQLRHQTSFSIVVTLPMIRNEIALILRKTIQMKPTSKLIKHATWAVNSVVYRRKNVDEARNVVGALA